VLLHCHKDALITASLFDPARVSHSTDGQALKHAASLLLHFFVQLVLLHGNKQRFDTPTCAILSLLPF
jgi:hypothetical protein